MTKEEKSAAINERAKKHMTTGANNNPLASLLSIKRELAQEMGN